MSTGMVSPTYNSRLGNRSRTNAEPSCVGRVSPADNPPVAGGGRLDAPELLPADARLRPLPGWTSNTIGCDPRLMIGMVKVPARCGMTS